MSSWPSCSVQVCHSGDGLDLVVDCMNAVIALENHYLSGTAARLQDLMVDWHRCPLNLLLVCKLQCTPRLQSGDYCATQGGSSARTH